MQEEDQSIHLQQRETIPFGFLWLELKLIDENPVETQSFPRREYRKPIDSYQPEEIIRLRDASRNPRERAIIEVFRSTGARVGEIADIKINQVNTDTGEILIKSGRFRIIYLMMMQDIITRPIWMPERTEARTCLPSPENPTEK